MGARKQYRSGKSRWDSSKEANQKEVNQKKANGGEANQKGQVKKMRKMQLYCDLIDNTGMRSSKGHTCQS